MKNYTLSAALRRMRRIIGAHHRKCPPNSKDPTVLQYRRTYMSLGSWISRLQENRLEDYPLPFLSNIFDIAKTASQVDDPEIQLSLAKRLLSLKAHQTT